MKNIYEKTVKVKMPNGDEIEAEISYRPEQDDRAKGKEEKELQRGSK